MDNGEFIGAAEVAISFDTTDDIGTTDDISDRDVSDVG